MRNALMIALLAACGSNKPTTTVPPPPTHGSDVADTGSATTPPVDTTPKSTKPVTNKSLADVGLDPAAMDKAANPCTDFYQFACGGWIKSTEIPADKSEAARSFVDIDDRNTEYERTVLDGVTKKADDAVSKQLAAFYGSCMDEATIEKNGIKPFAGLMASIASVKDPKSLSKVVADLHAMGIGVLFNVGPSQDPGDARNVIADLDQGGLGLPDRDYYLGTDDQTKAIRALYEDHVAKMLVAVGHKPDAAKTEAASIVALETGIAKVSKDKVSRRDPKGMYNKMDQAKVAAKMPKFDWATFWKTNGLAKVADINVDAPEFLAGLDALIQATKPEVWRAYLTFHVASRVAGIGPKNLEDTRFEFYKALTGQPQQEPRWKRCAGRTDGALGDLLGQLFVRDKFPGASKTAAEDQVHAISDAMAKNLADLPWMDDATKVKANEKLKAMSYQIGYPRKWRTYDFKLDPKTWAANAMAASKAEHMRQIAKIGKPVDKDDWQMTVPQVNAYYDPQLNGMVFPAGILQPPFYNVNFAVPVNLGGIGMVVGHELTHGFDDQGAQYDAVGNLTDWWKPETEKQFKAKTQCVIDQYSQYEITGGGKVNGALTVGENVADIGGIKLALTAYRSLRSSAADTVVADGFTEDQQFFLAFGQAWCSKLRPELEKMLVATNPHSPPQWRVNGALQATPEFAKVFGCKAGTKMAPAKACTVW